MATTVGIPGNVSLANNNVYIHSQVLENQYGKVMSSKYLITQL